MKICVPIQAKIQKEALKRLREAKKGGADVAELWLDQIGDLNLKTLLKTKPLPVVCVCKRVVDKGEFAGGFTALADMLLEAIECGTDYVDIPMSMPEKLSKKVVQEARKKKCKVIISHHDFSTTPEYSKLIKLVDSMAKRDADIVKIATHAKGMDDTVNIISLASYYQGKKTPHILIAMGQRGILSRILTPTLGGEMMFATLKKGRETAPGQLTVKELQNAWNLISRTK